jgi:PPOX class probable FMN-dependent enzyme
MESVSEQTDPHSISSLSALEAIMDTPRSVSIAKESAALTPLEREFVEASPFYLLATASPDGLCDVSPRGDLPGSVQVRDAQTLILPDRAGNNRIDSLRNIVTNPQVGLLFLVPGCDETLRVNGTARLTTDPAILEPLAMQGKLPRLAIVVTTTAVFMHCARAFRRSGLWHPETWPDTGAVPQMPAILKAKLAMPESVQDIAAEREARYKNTLY